MLKVFIKIIASICLGTACVYFVWVNSKIPNKKNNGFNREILSKNLQTVYHVKLPENARLATGVIDGNIIIPSEDPDYFLSVDSVGTIQFHTIPSSLQFLNERNPKFNILAKPNGEIIIVKRKANYAIVYNLKTYQITKKHIATPNYFHCAALNGEYLLFQFPSSNGKRFGIYDLFSDTIDSNLPRILSKKNLPNDISSDGQILYDYQKNIIAYMYHYKNRIAVFDDSLNLAKEFNTIDTVSNSLVYGLKGPIMSSNQKGSVYNGILYVSSNLKADNESRKIYMENIPIDRYDLSTGKYLDSFYLPLSGTSIIKYMQAFNGNLIAIQYHDNSLALYRII